MRSSSPVTATIDDPSGDHARESSKYNLPFLAASFRSFVPSVPETKIEDSNSLG